MRDSVLVIFNKIICYFNLMEPSCTVREEQNNIYIYTSKYKHKCHRTNSNVHFHVLFSIRSHHRRRSGAGRGRSWSSSCFRRPRLLGGKLAGAAEQPQLLPQPAGQRYRGLAQAPCSCACAEAEADAQLDRKRVSLVNILMATHFESVCYFWVWHSVCKPK